METFVNLMGNDLWSDDDIKARLHAEFRAEISEFAEREIYRALHALHLKMRPLSLAEQGVIGKFAAVDMRVAALGIAARANAALLVDVFAHEAAMNRLAQPGEAGIDLLEREAAMDRLAEPEVAESETDVAEREAATARLEQPVVVESEASISEREAAMAVVASATQAVLDLYLLRNPPLPEEPVAPVEDETTTEGDLDETSILQG